jgi:hypothetical protein
MATQENKVGENDEDVGRMSILEFVSKESLEEFFGKDFLEIDILKNCNVLNFWMQLRFRHMHSRIANF